jgi:hypothetical protein
MALLRKSSPEASKAGKVTGGLGAGGGSARSPQDLIRSALMAYDARQQAQAAADRNAEAGGSAWRRNIDRVRLQKADQAYRDALGGKGMAGETKPKPKPQPAPAAPTTPVVAVPPPGQPGNVPVPTLPVNDAPVAVTNPASQISPEEEAARLRARLLLMGNGTRGGRLGLSGGGFLGVRSLGAM